MLFHEQKNFQKKLAERGLEMGTPDCLKRLIEVPAESIWNVISQPGKLSMYHPYCKANNVFAWPGIGAKDGITYYSGLYFERDFIQWNEGVGYDLEIGPPPRKTAWISWNITPLEQSKSELMIQVTPLLESYLLEKTKRVFINGYFGQTINQYLDNLLRGVEHYVITGRPVKEKQFGSHPIYAP